MKRTLTLVLLAVALATPPPTARATASSEDPLDDARKAAAETPFSGSVTLQWREGSVLHTEHLKVRGSHGAVLAEGGRSAMAVGNERLVYMPGDGWHELWPSGLGATGHPAIDSAYETRAVGRGAVAGYDTTVVEIRKNGVVRERLDLDAATKLVLRRQQYDRRGVVERAFVFDQARVPDPAVTTPTMPPAPKHDGPASLASTRVPRSEQVPGLLADGFRRLGAYEHAGIVQLVYGDGLYDLSLFQQHGRLETSDLPAHRRTVRFDGRTAWQFSWPGGEGLTWTAGRTVYTLVGDVPPDDLVAVATSVPVHGSTSVAHRLRQACRAVVETFSWSS
jgi:negative regulator of sigma E activity